MHTILRSLLVALPLVGAAAATPVLLASTAAAHEYKLGDLAIEHPWTRATPPGARVGGGYLTVVNAGGTDDRLVSATSPASARVEIHEMSVTDGVMVMRPLPEGLPMPAGATVALAPGGLHLMLIDLAAPLVEGERVPVELTFERAGTVSVELAVDKIGARAPTEAQGDGHGDAHQGH
ncbi:copper chaperone PCu(A)C [Methylobrevis albus]|uniref:Copper chaperone PCu(A)C n=1 Tax=Methylobrevis albus TaxID=2793297 RepID=A0A931HZM7_9HYPH|nr:copper chaperone PCu(A)C [Methylobrevis albus]MBH0237677.1 copper chaperone PCu(A)C [Methylobrevis albus]